MVRKAFLVYDYYYEIPCDKCGKSNPALDFAEHDGTHPFQIGDLQPEEDVIVWKPTSEDEFVSQEFPHKAWGSERIVSMGRPLSFKRLDSLDEYSPKSTWDALAPHWLTVEEENYHHKYRILPDVYRMLDVQKDDMILDVACGKGDVARHLAQSGAIVTGIDISKMLDYAIRSEENEKLGISYYELNAERLSEKFDESSFDKVVCNMALMDMVDFKTTINQISYVLKEKGIFVFSILHPALSWPSCRGIRIPNDSERNEDKIIVILDYFDERPIVYGAVDDSTPSLQFHRPISSYLNELIKNDLVLQEMSEPKVSEKLVQRIPRKAYWDDEKRPEFLIVKAVKKSDL
jgi:2-polyprenyl-3-methyl-5-hydroxy-6-metoxy-1,4-benzoquinol methylase